MATDEGVWVRAAGHVDRRSPVPLHAQVEAFLRDLIREPRYVSGNLLPDEVSLAEALGVSRSTIRAGMTKLMFEGLIERRQGLGTRVVEKPAHTSATEWHSLTKEMQSKGFEVTNFEYDLQLVVAMDEVALALQLRPASKVWRLKRVRGWEGNRVVLTISWMHPRLRIKGDEDFHQPLYSVIESVSGVVPQRSIEDISACLADRDLAAALGVAVGSPLLVRRRTALDANDAPFEYNVNWYRTDIHSLALDLRRDD